MPTEVVITPNYRPHPKQLLLHNAPVSYDDIWIILYGGARGAGKSAGALADAIMFCQTYPGAKVCILRENLDAVKQSFLDKLPSLFPQEMQGVRLYEYREKSSSWYPSRSIVFPNGSYITLQRVANYEEAIAKQGWEFHYLIIDEVTKQEERTFNYLLTLVRSAEVHNKYTNTTIRIPTKVVLGCNPGGIGHKWVKKRFIDRTVVKTDEFGTPTQTKDCIELVRNPRDNSYIKTYIRFIPASYKDNPFLNASYVANLLALPEHQRKMDMYGNWDVVAGKMFDIKPDQRIHPKAVAEDLRRYEGRYEVYVSIDWGYKPSYHSAHWHAVFPDGSVITFKELYGQELIFEEFVATIRDMSRDYDIAITCLPHDMFRHGENYRDNTGRVIGETKSDVFEDAQLSPIPVESGKGKVQMRYDKIYSACELRRPDGTPKFKISEDCPMLLDELDHAVHSDIVPEEMAKGCADHAIDDYGLFLVFYSEDIEEIGQEKPAPDMRSNLQRKMDEDEERLEQSENESLFVGVDSDF